MNVEELHTFCMTLKATEETFPFDNETLVFKVMGKMYAIIPLESPTPSISLKCDPERAIELREEYDGINPGWHLSKKHWNSVATDITPRDLVIDLIKHSYELVVKGLTKKAQRELEEL